MIVTHLSVKNWRNFRHVDVGLRRRQFIVGPNAAGKSNLLDVFRFLRDIASAEGGGLQKAVKDRGGVGELRNLAARRDPEIALEIHLGEDSSKPPAWRYALGISQETRGRRQVLVTHERVWSGTELVLDRPDSEDEKDPDRLTQTYLEQINANRVFRQVAHVLQSVTYLHLVPQLLRFSDRIQGSVLEHDPFGQGFLEKIARTPERTRRSRLARIEEGLRIGVPQLERLRFVRDEATGRPHLEALYCHWRPKAPWQREDQFSDGTIRLIGLLWALLEGDALLLLEEPELSLDAGVIHQLAPLIHRMQRARRRQVLVSTHSDALLTESGIDGREVLLLTPAAKGTEVLVAAEIEEVRVLLESGFSVGEVVLPRNQPQRVDRLATLRC